VSDTARRTLRDILDLAPAGEDRWVAPTPGEGPPRLFGGQVAAQALLAACRTVPAERPPHSLHSYFIRPGRPDTTLELVVERTRDGRSFTTRHVTALQEGKAIFSMSASFHVLEPGTDWQEPAPRPARLEEGEGAPGLETPRAFWHFSPFEIRPVRLDPQRFVPHPCWVRLVEELPDDPALQACALTYVSDTAVVASARAPQDQGQMASMASLDHAVWFHRPVDVGRWHLFSVDPVSNFGGRGLARATLHDGDGRLVASIAQEALIRPL
jgi:acyl-CoA thioesterase-2